MSKLSLRTEGDTHVICHPSLRGTAGDCFPRTYRAEAYPEMAAGTRRLDDAGLHQVGEARRHDLLRWPDCKGAQLDILTGEYVELEPFSRIIHGERMHMPDPTPDNHVETRFEADGTGTLMTMRMTLPDAETRTAMLATGMDQGMEASYARLEDMLRSGELAA